MGGVWLGPAAYSPMQSSPVEQYYWPPSLSWEKQGEVGPLVGIIIALVVVVVVVGFVAFCVVCRCRRSKNVTLDVEINKGPSLEDCPLQSPDGKGAVRNNIFKIFKIFNVLIHFLKKNVLPFLKKNVLPFLKKNILCIARLATSLSIAVCQGLVGKTSSSDKSLPLQSLRVAIMMSNKSEFTQEELAMATNDFSRENLLGQGGFGFVYKGVLPNGNMVAVKQLRVGSHQGEREFQAEVEIISRVHHRHLVSLVGYCISEEQRMLVYEFAPNGTLDFHLHGKGKPVMKWEMRMKLALGSAKGLAYLHEDCHPKIIHRDIKAANILVDKDFEAKVADFGLAKFSLDTETHITTRIMGTFGYLAPEYASTGKLTDKSDVFSFGIVLVELISGRYPIDKNDPSDESMVEWARPLLKQAMETENYDDLVDPKLKNDYISDEMKRMIACAAACLCSSARLRPKMSQIVRALEGNLLLAELRGVQPAHNMLYGSQGIGDDNTGEYKKDMEKFRKLALESQDYTTGESSVPSTTVSSVNSSV